MTKAPLKRYGEPYITLQFTFPSLANRPPPRPQRTYSTSYPRYCTLVLDVVFKGPQPYLAYHIYFRPSRIGACDASRRPWKADPELYSPARGSRSNPLLHPSLNIRPLLQSEAGFSIHGLQSVSSTTLACMVGLPPRHPNWCFIVYGGCVCLGVGGRVEFAMFRCLS